MYYKVAIEDSPLQAYISTLVFSPVSSLLRGIFQKEEPMGVIVTPLRETWSACLQTFEGHSSSVYSVAFSDDSSRLASASRDRTVKIWDTVSGECLRTLEGHSDWVYSVAFSDDSSRLASASDDGTVKIWDTVSGECLQTLRIGRKLVNISFDATGSCLHTEIGAITLNISSNSSPNIVNPRYQGWALSSDGVWITYSSENWVWLPPEYRPSCSAVLGKTIGIGVGSGRVWILQLKG